MQVSEVTFAGITHGAEAVCRLPDGSVCFVAGGIPGERASIEVVMRKRRWARGRLLDVLDASCDRVEAPCPYYGECGGCQLQHVAGERQAMLKRQIVTEQLERVGGISDPPVAELVRPGGDNWYRGYRTSARFAVDAHGRLGFHRSRSNDVIAIDRCLLLAPPAQALREEVGDAWRGAAEVSIRVGLATGGRTISVNPDTRGAPAMLRGDATITEHVAGSPFRVSPGSFFQPGPAGAEALTALVLEAAAVRGGDMVLDLYAGVGLFSRALTDAGARVVAVEASALACEDARSNLDASATVVHGKAERIVRDLVAERRRVDVVVLDPPRRGAGAGFCVALTCLAPRVIVYVACDPAALARDARALTDAGYPLACATPVDQFGYTSQIETVAAFSRRVELARG
ncbi:MAG: class I SAM-dependent RNA methyltransferase [Egibacteraceae bacterium]